VSEQLNQTGATWRPQRTGLPALPVGKTRCPVERTKNGSGGVLQLLLVKEVEHRRAVVRELRLLGPRQAVAHPSHSITPLVGVVSPAIRFSSVDLPQPECPIG
jgi:hypothetical protein